VGRALDEVTVFVREKERESQACGEETYKVWVGNRRRSRLRRIRQRPLSGKKRKQEGKGGREWSAKSSRIATGGRRNEEERQEQILLRGDSFKGRARSMKLGEKKPAKEACAGGGRSCNSRKRAGGPCLARTLLTGERKTIIPERRSLSMHTGGRRGADNVCALDRGERSLEPGTQNHTLRHVPSAGSKQKRKELTAKGPYVKQKGKQE